MESYEMESMMVDGPISYSCWLYRNPEGRPTIIHNFGDKHYLRSGCAGKQAGSAKGFVSIEDLISETMINPYAVVDFFFEAPRSDSFGHNYTAESGSGYCGFSSGYCEYKPLLSQGALNRLDDKFRNCLSVGSQFLKKCRKKFPNGRIHAIDIRNVLGIKRNFIPDMEDKESKTWQFFKILVRNQIFRVEDENVRNELYEIYNDIKALSPKELYKQTYVYLMDIYLLGRLFRSYVPLLGQKQKTAFNNASVQNAVIYSGDHHKKNYDYFFRNIGAVELYSFKSPKFTKYSRHTKGGDSYQCVQIPKLKYIQRTLPIVEEFSNNPDIIVQAYKQFNKKYKKLSKNRLHRHYSINRGEAEVITQVKFKNDEFKQDVPKKKYPQAKRQKIEPQEGKEEEP